MADYDATRLAALEARLRAIDHEDITKEELMKEYDTWSQTYDQDLTCKQLQNLGPVTAARAMSHQMGTKKDARILDLCAGTGLAGCELAKLGYTNLDALDGSVQMLNEARKKGIYKTTIQHMVGSDRIPVDDDTYDGVVAVACFFPSHVSDGSCFSELIRIVRPGGVIVMIIISGFFPQYEPAMQKLASEGKWRYETKPFTVSRETPAVVVEIIIS